MDEEAALWQAIHDAPTDEAPWLVLADWLEENDDPLRAELFRTTLALRRGAAGARRARLEARQRELLAAGVRPAVPEVVNSVGMRLVLVPPGTFWMGSPEHEELRSPDEGPRRQVTISRAFYLGACPVTQEQFQRVTRRNPSHFSAAGGGRSAVKGLDTQAFPVESVSWEEAVAFCARLSGRREEKKAGRAYRLPTEAEWEHACRAFVAADTYHFGPALSSAEANIDDSRQAGKAPRGRSLHRTCAVGSYPPNALGLFDLHGNVDEWCSDWYAPGYYANAPERDPPGPAAGDRRAVRGGSWLFPAAYSRTACRGGFGPRERRVVVGLRVACTVGR